MNSLFEDLKEGLQEAINFEKGTTPAKKITYIIAPVTEYNPTEIRAIRMNAGMTQNIFANYMGLSKKSVEEWESGRTHPTGSAFRLMSILSNNKTNALSFFTIE